eukprot:3262424-Alexandrium_andersonii.AAC.1
MLRRSKRPRRLTGAVQPSGWGSTFGSPRGAAAHPDLPPLLPGGLPPPGWRLRRAGGQGCGSPTTGEERGGSGGRQPPGASRRLNPNPK